jgi:hypothetical protein
MHANIDLDGIIVIVGNYGSGKTEIAVNLAVDRKRSGLDVSLADLDLVNPYFRTREARTPLRKLGIDIVLPPEELLQADLPILSPLIAGLLRNPRPVTIIDVGGNDAGATVLSSLVDGFKGRPYHMLQVINPLRPNTDSIDGCLRIRDEIQAASRLTINGIVGNANLIDETGPDDIHDGYRFVSEVAARSGLPLRFITAARHLLPQIDTSRFECPVLPIDRQLVPPWLAAEQL